MFHFLSFFFLIFCSTILLCLLFRFFVSSVFFVVLSLVLSSFPFFDNYTPVQVRMIDYKREKDIDIIVLFYMI